MLTTPPAMLTTPPAILTTPPAILTTPAPLAPPPPMPPLAPPPPMPPRMCPCETYEVSGASLLAPQAMGRYDRVGKHPHHDPSSPNRPFDVFRNAEAGTYLYFWAPSLDWHIGTEVCSYTSSCSGVIAVASHDSNVGCPYATTGRPWSAKRMGSQGQTQYVPLPGLTIACPSPPTSPPAPPVAPPLMWPAPGGTETGYTFAETGGILGGAVCALLLLLTFLYVVVCRPKRDANLSRGGVAVAAAGQQESSIRIATGVPVPQGRIATVDQAPLVGVPALGVELERMPPSALVATVAEVAVAPGRGLPEAIGVPIRPVRRYGTALVEPLSQ